MKLLYYSDNTLYNKTKPFDFQNPPFDSFEFAQDLVKFMYDHNCINITANQVNIPYQIFAMRGSPENFVCFNPKIVMPSSDQIKLEETSITTPGLIVKVTRHQHVKVRFATPNGQIRTETFTGMTARAFQQSHQILNGEPFWSSVSRLELSNAQKRAKKLGYEYKMLLKHVIV
jgi:peptide deformylase